MRRIKNQQLPEWFDIARYERSENLDLRGWHLNLVPRMILCDLLKEKGKYRQQLQKCFEKHIARVDNLLVIENESDSIDDQFALTNYSEDAESRLTQATVRSLPASYSVWAIAQALNDDSDLSKSLLSASKKVWAIDHPAGENELDDMTDNLVDQPIDLLERKGTQLEDQYLHIEVDMFAPDSMIISSFQEWLKAAREVFDLPSRNLFTPAEIRKWSKFQILPFIDLTVWAELAAVKIPDQAMGVALFPNEHDVSLNERIAKVVRPMANRLTRMSIVCAIDVQSLNME